MENLMESYIFDKTKMELSEFLSGTDKYNWKPFLMACRIGNIEFVEYFMWQTKFSKDFRKAAENFRSFKIIDMWLFPILKYASECKDSIAREKILECIVSTMICPDEHDPERCFKMLKWAHMSPDPKIAIQCVYQYIIQDLIEVIRSGKIMEDLNTMMLKTIPYIMEYYDTWIWPKVYILDFLIDTVVTYPMDDLIEPAISTIEWIISDCKISGNMIEKLHNARTSAADAVFEVLAQKYLNYIQLHDLVPFSSWRENPPTYCALGILTYKFDSPIYSFAHLTHEDIYEDIGKRIINAQMRNYAPYIDLPPDIVQKIAKSCACMMVTDVVSK